MSASAAHGHDTATTAPAPGHDHHGHGHGDHGHGDHHGHGHAEPEPEFPGLPPVDKLPSDFKPVLLYGATGYTGRLCAKTLARRGIPFILAGREWAKLSQTARALGQNPDTVRTADAEVPESLKSLFDGVSVIINCAGPFTDLGLPVVEAAVKAGVPYVDTTGEQGFMLESFNRFHAEAQRKGVAIIHGMAFEYSLGDIACALLGEKLDAGKFPQKGGRSREGAPIDELHVTYAIKDPAMSRGTMKTIFGVLAKSCGALENGKWVERPAGALTRMALPRGRNLPLNAISFAAGEPLQVPQHTRVKSVHSYITAGEAITKLSPLAAHIVPVMNKLKLNKLAHAMLDALGDGPDGHARAATRFSIIGEAIRGSKRAKAELTGSDAYGITAELAVEGALWLALGKARQHGVIGAATAFVPAEFFERVFQPMGVEIHFDMGKGD